MRAELGDAYTNTLRAAYRGRVAGGADLVCYWFEKARGQIERGALRRAGLVSSNMLPAGTLHQAVLARAAEVAPIFEAWRDLPWVNNGAAVRVALTALASEPEPCRLDGNAVQAIGPDLQARNSAELAGSHPPAPLAAFRQPRDRASRDYEGWRFQIGGSLARAWLRMPNPHGRTNADVLKPWRNGEAVTKRDPDMWIIDFYGKTSGEAALYEAPFAHVVEVVKPKRDRNNEPATRRNWWLFKRSGADMRSRVGHLARAIGAPETPTHTVFGWLPRGVIADKNLVVVARADDTSMGLVSARPHLVWVKRFGGRYGDHPTARRYNSTRTFRAFPLSRRPHSRRHRWSADPSAARRSADPRRPAAGRASSGRGYRPRRQAPRRSARCMAQPT